MNELKVWLRSMLPTIREMKTMTGVFLLATVIFTSIMFYRTEFVDPAADAAYAQINGTEEE